MQSRKLAFVELQVEQAAISAVADSRYLFFYMTVMMTSAQVVEMSANVTNNSPSRDYSHPDEQTTMTI